MSGPLPLESGIHSDILDVEKDGPVSYDPAHSDGLIVLVCHHGVQGSGQRFGRRIEVHHVSPAHGLTKTAVFGHRWCAFDKGYVPAL